MSEPDAVLEAISHDKVYLLTLGPELSLCPSPSIVVREGRSLQNPTCVGNDCDSRLGNVAVTHSSAGDSGRSEVTKLSTRAARRDGRSIPSLFSRCISVVRFKPSFTAAPFGPPIFQPLACRAWSMSARSESRNVIGTESWSRGGFSVAGESVMGATAVGSGFGSTPSRARITARSTRFCSSRMLPGQE